MQEPPKIPASQAGLTLCFGLVAYLTLRTSLWCVGLASREANRIALLIGLVATAVLLQYTAKR